MENGYYPAGAQYDPSAPYNEYENEEVETTVEVEVHLLKKGVVCTCDYTYDEYGYDFSTADLCEKWQEQTWSIPQMLDELKNYIEKELATNPKDERRIQLKEMLRDCQGWEQNDEIYLDLI